MIPDLVFRPRSSGIFGSTLLTIVGKQGGFDGFKFEGRGTKWSWQ